METNTVTNSFDEQLAKSDTPPKMVSRFRWVLLRIMLPSCGCLLAILLLIFSILVWGFLIDTSAYHPTRYRAIFVQDHEIPNIVQELAGEWMVELPTAPLIFYAGMRGWRETRFILNEDGTCKIHNLTMSMATSRLYPEEMWYLLKEQPEWVGKTFSGTWKSVPLSVSGYPEGSRLPTKKVYAAIAIYGEKNSTVKDADNYYSGLLMVWKVKENGQVTYRLRMFNGNDEFITDRDGIILKRVE